MSCQVFCQKEGRNQLRTLIQEAMGLELER